MKIKKIKKSNFSLEKKKKIIKIATLELAYLCLFGFSLVAAMNKKNYQVANIGKENVGYLLQDANGEWDVYKEKISVSYLVKGSNYQNNLIMGLEKEEENKRTFRSLTVPEYTLIETTDEENYNVEYVLQDLSLFSEEKIEEFSNTHVVTCVAWCIGDKIASFEEIKEQERQREELENKKIGYLNFLTETDNTLLKYNNWLLKSGSFKRLTKEDLRKIEAQTNSHPESLTIVHNKPYCNKLNGIYSIKISPNEYRQVGTEYYFVETEEGNLELRLNGSHFDMLTGKEIKSKGNDNYTMLNFFSDYVGENEIQSIGYTTQQWSAWSDKDTAFIRENYGEDILECLRENGFPIPCYDINDFYEAHVKSLEEDILRIKIPKQ